MVQTEVRVAHSSEVIIALLSYYIIVSFMLFVQVKSWVHIMGIGGLLDSLYTHPSFSLFSSQQQYKFVYMTIKHYVESQQAPMNVVHNSKS